MTATVTRIDDATRECVRRRISRQKVWRIRGVYPEETCECRSFWWAVTVARGLVASGWCAYAAVEDWDVADGPEVHYLVGNRDTYEMHMGVQRRQFGHAERYAPGCIFDWKGER